MWEPKKKLRRSHPNEPVARTSEELADFVGREIAVQDVMSRAVSTIVEQGSHDVVL
jgi:hypothetical protein